ncbi:beta-lactamase family protein [Streptomyces sp. 15-116A]|uniref:serine hydrolase domain-containing protein n=1 Tax=Streptomyces sp. 15-116A TaxID=2259035 RepID=UPI0021B3C201|nr:serine hydrolase [Streptomyces sp. 15-116A]MCT7350670.1 beta-lactamase family protein [Streptomyces sp. 15-116A]
MPLTPHVPAPISLATWQQGPHNRYTAGRMREVVPTARVAAGPHPIPLPDGEQLTLDLPVTSPSAGTTTVADIVARTCIDGLIVVHRGTVRHESYPGDLTPDRPHMLYSVSKSIIGVIAAGLVADGHLDVDELITAYVPELAGSGYSGATVRDILDMRSGIRFSEDYLTPGSDVSQIDQAVGWAPREDDRAPASLYEYLRLLRAERERAHGGPFTYRSCETDVLGWVCERAAGERMPELLSRRLWSRLAEQDMDAAVDRSGTVFFDGGLAATLRDTARFGELVRRDGGRQNRIGLVPAHWIEDCLTGGPDSRQAFADDPSSMGLFPGGMYRNQFWVPYAERRVLLCLGIHGQMLYIDFDNEAVVAQLSSWPVQVQEDYLQDAFAAVETIIAAL